MNTTVPSPFFQSLLPHRHSLHGHLYNKQLKVPGCDAFIIVETFMIVFHTLF